MEFEGDSYLMIIPFLPICGDAADIPKPVKNSDRISSGACLTVSSHMIFCCLLISRHVLLRAESHSCAGIIVPVI